MKIAIAGYGVEGEANYKYWSLDPANELTIVDEGVALERSLPEGVATILGEGAFSKLADFDMVVRTAGLAPRKIITNGKIWSATNEFFSKSPAPIIGVTGSKGKGTTASLIAAILEASGKKAWLVGNIGVSALDVLSQIQPDHVVVYELSSFQLWDLERSPHTAVVLFIEPEHLNVHASMEEYVEAKAQITKYQGPEDLLIFNARNQYAASIAAASQARTVGYPNETTAHIQDGAFYYGDQLICQVDALQLKGEHNQDNALAAIDAAWQYVSEPSYIEAGLRAFKGLPHRLAFVRTVKGVDYYDDSIATTPSSAIAALRAFGDRPKVIILGGSSKGASFGELATELMKHDVWAILIGDEAANISQALRAVGFTNFEIIEQATAENIVGRAAAAAQDGSVVLLSPAAASFGLFKNYSDRGDQFVAAVNAL